MNIINRNYRTKEVVIENEVDKSLKGKNIQLPDDKNCYESKKVL